MSTFLFEGKRSIFLGAQAQLIDTQKEVASDWAVDKITINPANAWILGKFVEADNANNNGQYFAMGDLELAKPSIDHAPMNINHSSREIVGAFVASELVFPVGEQAAQENPYIESLGVFWRFVYPDAYRLVQKAAAEGSLFYSMEAIPEYVSTVGGADDSIRYEYAGRTSPTYPDELNAREVPMRLGNPHFVGGALIIPPVRPGWSGANTGVVAEYMEECWQEAERAYEGIKSAAPHLDARVWEAAMAELILMDAEMEWARNFSTDQRKKMAKDGSAMPDGSFPIKNEGDLHNAIRLAGNAKNPDAARAHIKARAKALGLSKLIPDTWK